MSISVAMQPVVRALNAGKALRRDLKAESPRKQEPLAVSFKSPQTDMTGAPDLCGMSAAQEHP